MQANDIRRGQAVLINKQIYVATEVMHRTPGNLRAFVQVKLKNFNTGEQISLRWSSTEEIESAYLELKRVQFLYSDPAGFHFMELDTYEQMTLSADFVDDAKNYLKENDEVELDIYEGKAIRIRLPKSVSLKIVEAPPGVKGDSVNRNTKEAKLETGLTVQVPIFIEPGTVIRVDTETGEYLGKA